MSLLEPVPPIDPERPLGRGRIQEDEPIGPANSTGSRFRKPSISGTDSSGNPVIADDAHVVVADPGLEAAVEVLGGEHPVEVHRDRRHADRMPEPGDARVEVREQRRGAEPHQRQPRRQRVLQGSEGLPEDVEHLVPSLRAVPVALEEQRGHAILDLRRRTVRHGAEIVAALEVGALGGVLLAALRRR